VTIIERKGFIMDYDRDPGVIVALRALGEILESQGESAAIVVVGGAALIIQGYVERATRDIDVIAISRDVGESERRSIENPEPLPKELMEAISRVARDYNLPGEWMNTTVSLQWSLGLPPGFGDRIHWRRYGGLWVGLADRHDLIFLKLYAAVDSEGPSSVHYQDLVALEPTHEELDDAAQWVISQDISPQFAHIVRQVVEHAKRNK
jgi:hypothetical protein